MSGPVRLYVPPALEALRDAVVAGGLGVVPDAVVAEGDGEEQEYAALMTAADASAALLDGPGRRVVAVAEVASDDAPVALADLVALHADAADRPTGADPDEDLGWYAVQELADLLA